MKNEIFQFYFVEKLKGNFIDLDIDKLYEEIIDLNDDYFSNRNENDELSLELGLLEIIHFRNNFLWININQKFKFKAGEIHKSELDLLFYDYMNILTITQNNLLVLYRLLSEGFEYQAQIILRNHLELFELKLSILGDKNQYEKYKEILESNGKEFNRSIKFSSTSKSNKKILKELKEKKGFEIYDGFFEILHNLKSKYYKEFSSSVHPNRTKIMLGANVFIDKENLAHSLGGLRGLKTKDLLYDLFNIEIIFFQYILAVQIDKHKMYFKKYGEDAEKLAFMVGFCWNLLMKKLKENNES